MSEKREYTIEDKIEAAIAWLITGSSVEAGKLCGINDRTIRYWMQTEWWEDILREAQGRKQKELDALWTGIIHKTASELSERISKGDAYEDKKTGEIKRLPVKAKDLAVVMAIAVDKRALSRGQATSRTEKVNIDERLDKIGNKLEEKAKVING